MKTKNLILKSILVMTAASLVMTSCKKKTADDNDTDSARDNAYAESVYGDAANISDEAGQKDAVANYKGIENDNLLSTCATVTFSRKNNADKDTITIDFGATNCVCADGRSRRGQIIVYYTGKFKQPGSSHTITFNNYYVDDNNVAGTKTVTNNGLNTNSNMNWTISVNGTITLAAGGSITWTSTRGRELLAGWNAADSTISWATSKWSITGSANGTNSKGVTYTANIKSALIRDFTCPTLVGKRHFTQGVVDITPGGKPTRTIDFGNGTCDDQATVTINGKVYKVTLR